MKREVISLCLSLLLAAIVSPAAAYLEFHGQNEQLTPTVGGNGGEPLRVECDGFDYGAGLAVRYGNWIDAVDINCATPEEYKGQLRFGTPHGASAAWGGQGGTSGNDLCGPDEAMAGLRIQESPNHFVGYVSVLCRSLGNLNGKPYASGNPATYGRISDKSPPVQELLCPPGMIAHGIHGASGDYVDRLGLVCHGAPNVAHETILAGMDDNTNRAWSDYSHFTLPKNSAANCQSACVAQNKKCRAWAYVREGVQGSDAVCYLKDSAPPPVRDPCCISGIVANPILSSIKEPAGSMVLQPDIRGHEVTEANTSGGYARDANQQPDFSRYVPATTMHKSEDGPVIGEPGGFAGPAPTMTGTFDSDFGVLVLTKQDGTYSYKNGQVTITKIYGDFMDGTWSQSESSQKCPDGAYRGTFHFQFTESGFKGTYGYCDGPTNAGPWNGKRRAN